MLPCIPSPCGRRDGFGDGGYSLAVAQQEEVEEEEEGAGLLLTRLGAIVEFEVG